MTSALTWLAVKAFLKKNWLPIVILLAVVGGGWFLDHRGYERAKDQDRLHELERNQLATAIAGAIDKQLEQRLGKISADVSGKLQSIDTEGKTVVQPIFTRELIRDPGLADPRRCLTPGLLDGINAARGYPAGVGSGQAGPANPASVPGSGARH